ncbi:hypothetical protein LOK49_Contig544G00001 [Camellia lanceoleosa]|nr:hypothetical protein LOK49_Contig544G00001 [Camellia lanceoleosa]
MRLHRNIDKLKEADIYSKQADRINIVNQHKLPILYFLDMSTERGNLYPRSCLGNTFLPTNVDEHSTHGSYGMDQSG